MWPGTDKIVRAGHPNDSFALGDETETRYFQLPLAFMVEAVVLLAFGIWLGSWIPKAASHSTLGQAVVIRWIPRSATIQQKVQLPHAIKHGRPRNLLQPVQQPAVLLPSSTWRVPEIGMPSLKAATPLIRTPMLSSRGGAFGNGLWVDIPIPGAGGLPDTGLRVVQTRFGFLYGLGPDHRRAGYQWIEGRVNRAGKVVSVEIMRSNIGSAVVDHAVVRALLRWRFMPLRIHGYRTGFRIIAVSWFEPARVWYRQFQMLRDPQKRQWRWDGFQAQWIGREDKESAAMHWVLYPIKGHLPFAVPVHWGYGPSRISPSPPGLAQAVAYFLEHIRQR